MWQGKSGLFLDEGQLAETSHFPRHHTSRGEKRRESTGADGEEPRSSHLILVFDISGKDVPRGVFILTRFQPECCFSVWCDIYFTSLMFATLLSSHKLSYLTSPRSQSQLHPESTSNEMSQLDAQGRYAVSLENPRQPAALLGRESEHMGSNKPLSESWFLFIFPLSPIFLLKSFKKISL